MTSIVLIYCFCAICLALYGLNTHFLVGIFERYYPKQRLSAGCGQTKSDAGGVILPNGCHDTRRLPMVTTQLPIFNERSVVERLIEAVAAFHYPEGLHQIQVLDDSTDDTRTLVGKKVGLLRKQGVNIQHITRREREGYKAGALREGLETAKGDYVAIFDADFVPPPDFLLRTIPHFTEQPILGFLQARWGHLNREENYVTRLQAIGIDGHFMVEQGARNAGDLFMNFNGTAGVFRKQAIIDAGNWQEDTLTEDMDLSYRIQLRGWKCRYLIDLVAPAEIPGDINAFKSQQFRWAKGSIQTAIKLMPRIWRSSASPFAKFQAFMHMTHYVIHPLMLTLALLAPVLLLERMPFLSGFGLICFGGVLLLSCTGPSRMYLVAEKALGRPYTNTLKMLPFMMCFGCGLAINNSRAVIEAIIGKTSAFVRTPKRGDKARNAYHIGPSPLIFLELLTGLWCLFGMGLYFNSRHYVIGHFLLLYAVGFIFIGGLSWWQGRERGGA